MAIGHWFKNFTTWYFNPDAECGGDGGGSSDFSAAKVTVINNSGYSTVVYAAAYDDDDESGRFSIPSVISDGHNETVADIILYKGEAFISCENNIYWSFTNATGDIEIDSEYPDYATVRGNGTITLAHHG